jgi:DNA-binding transcriptional LysR family regulator
LPRVIRALKSLHSNLDIRLDISTSDQAFDAVLRGRSDLALAVDAPKHGLVQRKTLLVDELVLIAADEKLISQCLTALDFTKTVLILREPGSKTRAAVDRALDQMRGSDKLLNWPTSRRLRALSGPGSACRLFRRCPFRMKSEQANCSGNHFWTAA